MVNDTPILMVGFWDVQLFQYWYYLILKLFSYFLVVIV